MSSQPVRLVDGDGRRGIEVHEWPEESLVAVTRCGDGPASDVLVLTWREAEGVARELVRAAKSVKRRRRKAASDAANWNDR